MYRLIILHTYCITQFFKFLLILTFIHSYHFWVNAEEQRDNNRNSFSYVADKEKFDVYLQKYHPDKAKNLPDTGLAVIKVKIILMLKQKIISAFQVSCMYPNV